MIAQHYPGTKLAITEWNYGGGNNISGGLAAADALGAFGREGVDLATLWPMSGLEPYNQAAVRVYTNYDGHGGRFGDTSVAATTSSAFSASVYASVDAALPSRLVIVAINRRGAATTATITIAGGDAYARADVYRLGPSKPELAAQAALTATAPGQFEYAMPATSVSVIVPAP